MVVAPTDNIKLGDSIEALSIASQGEGSVVVHQHSQPTTPSEVVPVNADTAIRTESTWMKQQ
jgi:hypothetical protein